MIGGCQRFSTTLLGRHCTASVHCVGSRRARSISSLPASGGRNVSTADHRGRPVLVIFYLGFGCLHCVEQLQHFQPMMGAFRDAGIDIVAIGTDTVAGTRASVAAMKPADRFGFPLLIDADKGVFRSYRAFDDFEKVPLHGTFLLDAKGYVRWQDISYEPFDQPKWLLAECRRLLASKGSPVTHVR